MPINACGTEPNASYDPDPLASTPDPAATPAPPQTSASSAEDAPFIRFDSSSTQTPDGQVHGRASVLHGHDPSNGFDLEFLSIAAQTGPRATSVDAVVERFGFSTADAKSGIHAELFSVGAELGTHNADGSEGFGYGMGTVAAGIEATLPLPVGGDASTVTLGASVGAGFHASIGIRDADHDGKHEICARVVEEFTVGGCIELPF